MLESTRTGHGFSAVVSIALLGSGARAAPGPALAAGRSAFGCSVTPLACLIAPTPTAIAGGARVPAPRVDVEVRCG
ncbi:hypothetical protein GCM10027067_18110 [Pseudactinotalea suaedae]